MIKNSISLLLIPFFATSLLVHQPILAEVFPRTRARQSKKSKKQHLNTLIGITVGTLAVGFLTYLATYGSSSNQGEQNNQNESSCWWLEKNNQTTFSTTNQYKQKGFAACLHTASHLLKEHHQDLNKNLYVPKVLDETCKKGAEMVQGDMADEFSDIFIKYKNIYHFESLFTPESMELEIEGEKIMQPILLTSRDELKNGIQGGVGLEYSTALVRNGPEAWALIVHTDKTFSLFDSHGKQATYNNACAYIQHFDNLDKVCDYIIDNNTLRDIPASELTDEQKCSGGVYIYWVGCSENNG